MDMLTFEYLHGSTSIMTTPDFYCLHSELCKTLANAKRQQILDALRDGEVTVGQVVEHTGIAQANVSQHLSLMRGKGIVNSRRDGAYVYYRISNPKILQAFDLITEVMRESMEARNQAAGGHPSSADASEGGTR
jgi:ArsR family transcriptional regulator, virulence genes transcriptional regulator